MSEHTCNKPLTGRLSGKSGLKGTMSTKGAYDGEYSVKANVKYKVVLPTAGKALTKDITIEPIPFSEVENEAGGVTAIIG